MKYLLFIPLFIFVSKCKSEMSQGAVETSLDIQGHRGCRGLMPENSIPAFLLAVELGVSTLELDVGISKDHQVIVSHEPYFAHEISLDPKGKEITEEEERSHNLYQLTVEEIQKYDCGSKKHPNFPQQVNIKVYKPTLAEVFNRVEPLVKEFDITDLQYNIEIKRSPEHDGIFHPPVQEFVRLVVELIHEHHLGSRTIIQSFDAETLQEVRKIAPKQRVAWLVSNDLGLQKNLDILGFLPDIYSPTFELVDEQLVKSVHAQNITLVPWTVNAQSDISRMISMGVDGIISDYPDRVKQALTDRS